VKRTLVLTIIGDDHPGLVGTLAKVVADCGGNWEGSRMAHLGGKFAGIVQVAVDRDAAETLEQAVAALDGLQVMVGADERRGASVAGTSYRLELVGHDRPGIIRDISTLLANRGVNVEELHSDCDSAPMAGDTLFKMEADVLVPAGLDVNALCEELESLAHDLMVDLHWTGGES
jgi:glycine cleavage system regulatory protein